MNRYSVRRYSNRVEFLRKVDPNGHYAKHGSMWVSSNKTGFLVTAKDELDAWMQVQKYLREQGK